jgi:dihydrofolate reductase
MFIITSVDGYFEGPNHDISWHNVDDEFNEFAIEQLRQTDTILFGRRTYQLFEDAWPKIAKDPTTSTDNLEIANLINNMNKIVFSKTLPMVQEKENWKNVKLLRAVNPEEINRWKQQPGKDMSIGGNNLCTSFALRGLIDAFRIMINPIILGEGTPLFQGAKERLNLRPTGIRTFNSGNVMHCYAPLGSAKSGTIA